MILLLLACAPEYEIAPCPEDTALPTFATVADCPGYAAMMLPLVGDPLAVSWCSVAGECAPVEWSAGRWLYATCPDAGELRVLWVATESAS